VLGLVAFAAQGPPAELTKEQKVKLAQGERLCARRPRP
jgi:hypothetical protein